MKDLSGWSLSARPERPTSAILHDEPNVRVVGFHLLEGQKVPPHRNASTVIVQVVEGQGLFRGDGQEVVLHAGGTAAYAPGEVHSIDAVDGPLRFLAIISPAPG